MNAQLIIWIKPHGTLQVITDAEISYTDEPLRLFNVDKGMPIAVLEQDGMTRAEAKQRLIREIMNAPAYAFARNLPSFAREASTFRLIGS